MIPATPFTKADQTRLRSLKLEQSGTATPGRVIFCRGRSVLGYGDVSKLGDFLYIPKSADTVCVSGADWSDVKGWMGI
jgi:hypothetical protein